MVGTPIDKLDSIDLPSLEMRNLLRDFAAERAEVVRINAELTRAKAELEERVASRTEELLASNAELETFSYSVSHDLRGPLRAIVGYSHLLVRDHHEDTTPEAQRMLRAIERNAIQMGQLIDAILEFGRLGRQDLLPETVDLARLFRDRCEQERSALASDDATSVDLDVGALTPCRGDRAMLEQLVSNLVGNAFKYSGGRREPRIVVGEYLAGGEPVYFIRDNGAGFDPRYADKIFGVFERLHSNREFEGTGVGMAIAQRVIDHHRGRIWAEGEVDAGATFYFTIPGLDQRQQETA